MTADCVGGVWDYALTLAGELGRRGIQVRLAVIGGPCAPDQRRDAEAVPGLSLAEWSGKLEWMPGAADDVMASGRWLLEQERGFQPDIVHVNGYAHAALPFRAPVLCAAHSCVRSWFAAVHGREAPADYDAYTLAVRRGLRRAGLVVAPSRAMLDALRRHYGRLPHTLVIPNGRDPAVFVPQAKETFILSAGRVWDEAKNIQALADVAPRLGWPVLVAGDCRHPDGRERHPQGVKVLGRRPAAEMRDLYGHAAVFCLPAKYEPFGLAILEAALSGCTLVLGDIPSLRELWAGAAILIRPDDRDGLRHALNRVMSNAGWRADLAEAARIRARRLTACAMADSYLGAYSQVLGTRIQQLAAE